MEMQLFIQSVLRCVRSSMESIDIELQTKQKVAFSFEARAEISSTCKVLFSWKECHHEIQLS